MRSVNVTLLGCGTVGSGFVSLLARNSDRIAARESIRIDLKHVVVRDQLKERAGVAPALITADVERAIDRSDVVVELIGGIDDARQFVREALTSRKHVVTANKRLLAHSGVDLYELAQVHRVRIGFEASVCGAIPVVRLLRAGVGDELTSVSGIFNGTCNYILTQMESGVSYDEALAGAQRLGFAEFDPWLDVSGEDAAQKLRILATMAFGEAGQLAPITTTPIDGIDTSDVARAARRGCVIRQIARAIRVDDLLELSVRPEEVPLDHPFARVRDEQNIVTLATAHAGEITLTGRGAGAYPSASAVLSDVVEIARG